MYLLLGVVWFIVGKIIVELETDVWYWKLIAFLWYAGWLVAICPIYHGTRYSRATEEPSEPKNIEWKGR